MRPRSSALRRPRTKVRDDVLFHLPGSHAHMQSTRATSMKSCCSMSKTRPRSKSARNKVATTTKRRMSSTPASGMLLGKRFARTARPRRFPPTGSTPTVPRVCPLQTLSPVARTLAGTSSRVPKRTNSSRFSATSEALFSMSWKSLLFSPLVLEIGSTLVLLSVFWWVVFYSVDVMYEKEGRWKGHCGGGALLLWCSGVLT